MSARDFLQVSRELRSRASQGSNDDWYYLCFDIPQSLYLQSEVLVLLYFFLFFGLDVGVIWNRYIDDGCCFGGFVNHYYVWSSSSDDAVGSDFEVPQYFDSLCFGDCLWLVHPGSFCCLNVMMFTDAMVEDLGYFVVSPDVL